MADLKIRFRERSGYSREAGGYIGWGEYQVVDGRKIIGRFDTLGQAESFVEKTAKSRQEN